MQQRITKDAFINVDDDEGIQKQDAIVSLDQLMENEFKVTGRDGRTLPHYTYLPHNTHSFTAPLLFSHLLPHQIRSLSTPSCIILPRVALLQ